MGNLPRIALRSVVLAVVGVLIGGLAISLCIPATREMQVALFRLLFHLRGSHTEVIGQPPGCVIRIVPEVRFTQAYCHELAAAEGSSARGYILSRSTRARTDAFPPASAWKDHPLIGWAAMDGANQMLGINFRTDAHHDYEPRLLTRDERQQYELNVWDTIRLAQDSSPDDGGAWLAEAVVLLQAGQRREAMDAIREAIQRPAWQDTRRTALPYAAPMLIEQGLSRLDACMMVGWMTRMGGTEALLGRIYEALFAQIEECVETGDDRSLANLVLAISELGRVGRESLRLPWRATPKDRWSCLLPAMAAAYGISLPPSDNYEAREQIAEELVYRYLEDHAGIEITDCFRQEHREQEALRIQRCAECRSRRNDLGAAMLSSMFAQLALLLMAILISGLAAEVFAALARPITVPGGCKLTARFCLVMPIAFACITLLAFSATDGIFQPVGLRVECEPPILTPSQENLLASAGMAFVVLATRVAATRRHVWFEFCGVIVFAAYMTTMALAAWHRGQLVADIEMCFPR